MKRYDITYLSSNISFLLDCYINSFNDLDLLLIDREDKLGGAWQISDARVHLQWISNEHLSYIDLINKDLKKVDNRFEIKGPLKNVKTIDESVYEAYTLYHINLGSNLFMEKLIEKIRLRKNVTIVKDEISKILLRDKTFSLIGNNSYDSKKVYLTNNLKLDEIILNKEKYKLFSYEKSYNHLFIEIESKKIENINVLLCEGNGFKWENSQQFKEPKQKIHQDLYDSLFFMINVTELYQVKENIQLFSCRIKNNNFVENFKKYLIFNKITDKNVNIKILENDKYVQNRLIGINLIPKTDNLVWFTKMNYFKYLVKLKDLR